MQIYTSSSTPLFMAMLVLQTSSRLVLPSCQTLNLPKAVQHIFWRIAAVGPNTCSRLLYILRATIQAVVLGPPVLHSAVCAQLACQQGSAGCQIAPFQTSTGGGARVATEIQGDGLQVKCWAVPRLFGMLWLLHFSGCIGFCSISVLSCSKSIPIRTGSFMSSRAHNVSP